MKPFRRELINGLFVIVVGSLISTAFEAFYVNFDLHLWALIVVGVAVAVSGYAMLTVGLGYMASSEVREEEWLKRVGTPARLDFSNPGDGTTAVGSAIEAVKQMKPGSDFTLMYYVGAGGGAEVAAAADGDPRVQLFSLILELLHRGTIREYKRILCFEGEIIQNNHELKSGIIRVGQGPGTIDRLMGEHCRNVLQTRGGSVYLAPAIFRGIIGLYGTEEASLSIETVDPSAGGRRVNGNFVFHDPPNGEIIEELRQIERATERQMIAVREVRFPEDETAAATAR